MVAPVTTDRATSIGQAVAENGRVLATLDDWRAMGFVIVILFMVLVFIIVMLLRSTKSERKEMSEERTRMWAVADKFGEAADKLAIGMQVQAALFSRLESALDRNENASNGRG